MKRADFLLYAAVMFMSAFLLFQVEPIIGKFILPWFGGTPSVWTVCLLFFQAVLFGGYCYAHLITSKTSSRLQVLVHAAVLLTATVFVFTRTMLPGGTLKPADETAPAFQVLFILCASIGWPYFALAATSPLLQSWYGASHQGKEPYGLYAVSNAGALLALISYPFLVEPALSLHVQSQIWGIGFLVFAAGCIAAALLSLVPCLGEWQTREKTANRERKRLDAVPDGSARLLWFVLPMTAAMLLLAVTNQMCTDIASGPFLWILPLALYLISFVLTFTGWRFVYNRTVFFIVLVPTDLFIAYMLIHPLDAALVLQIGVYCLTVYCGCTALHGELYRLRPQNGHLTRYYLFIAAGGAAGGVLAGIVAPLVFNDYYELPIACVAVPALLALLEFRHSFGEKGLKKRAPLLSAAATVLLAMSAMFVYEIYGNLHDVREVRRNFFGVVKVQELFRQDPWRHEFRLMHGNTQHGFQRVDALLRQMPTSYYSVLSGVALAISEYPPRTAPIRVGAVGLGIGMIAAYAQPGDHYRFYEINPAVIAIAQNPSFFTYLRDARRRDATIHIVAGDARLSMERDLAAGYENAFDVLVLDAFSGDAIPVHLLTKEAFSLYFRLLKKEGVLAVHITNRNVDLAPVVEAMAHYYRYHPLFILNKADPAKDAFLSRWILLTNNAYFVRNYYTEDRDKKPNLVAASLWTDDCNNLFSLLKKQPLLDTGG